MDPRAIRIKDLESLSRMWTYPEVPIAVLIDGKEVPVTYAYCTAEACVLKPIEPSDERF